MKALIVHRDESIRRLLRALLEAAFGEAISCDDAPDAEFVESFAGYDLLISGGTIYGTLQRVAERRSDDTPIIVVTGTSLSQEEMGKYGVALCLDGTRGAQIVDAVSCLMSQLKGGNDE